MSESQIKRNYKKNHNVAPYSLSGTNQVSGTPGKFIWNDNEIYPSNVRVRTYALSSVATVKISP